VAMIAGFYYVLEFIYSNTSIIVEWKTNKNVLNICFVFCFRRRWSNICPYRWNNCTYCRSIMSAKWFKYNINKFIIISRWWNLF
jgi:hypothetical protein